MNRQEEIADLMAKLNELKIYPNNSTQVINPKYVESVEYIFSQSTEMSDSC